MLSFAMKLFLILSLLHGLSQELSARDAVIGYSGGPSRDAVCLASRKGFFKEANLDVKMIYMSTSIAAKGLMSGDVDYSTRWVGIARGHRRAPIVGIYSMFKAQMYLVRRASTSRLPI